MLLLDREEKVLDAVNDGINPVLYTISSNFTGT